MSKNRAVSTGRVKIPTIHDTLINFRLPLLAGSLDIPGRSKNNCNLHSVRRRSVVRRNVQSLSGFNRKQ